MNVQKQMSVHNLDGSTKTQVRVENSLSAQTQHIFFGLYYSIRDRKIKSRSQICRNEQMNIILNKMILTVDDPYRR